METKTILPLVAFFICMSCTSMAQVYDIYFYTYNYLITEKQEDNFTIIDYNSNDTFYIKPNSSLPFKEQKMILTECTKLEGKYFKEEWGVIYCPPYVNLFQAYDKNCNIRHEFLYNFTFSRQGDSIFISIDGNDFKRDALYAVLNQSYPFKLFDITVNAIKTDPFSKVHYTYKGLYPMVEGASIVSYHLFEHAELDIKSNVIIRKLVYLHPKTYLPIYSFEIFGDEIFYATILVPRKNNFNFEGH